MSEVVLDPDFSGADEHKMGDRLPEFEAGSYVVELLAAKKIKSRKGQKFGILEAKILQSTGEKANPTGSLAKQMIELGTDMTMRKIKPQVAGILGIRPSEVDQKALSAVYSSPESVKGIKMHLHVVMATSKNDKQYRDFRWSAFESAPVAVNDNVEVAAKAAATKATKVAKTA